MNKFFVVKKVINDFFVQIKYIYITLKELILILIMGNK